MSKLNWVEKLPVHENQKFINEEFIQEAAGYFSLCWDENGKFESEKALVASQNLAAYLAADMPSNMWTAMAVQILIKKLKEDEDYRQTWIANIAMAFKDCYDEDKTFHEIANKAADSFLNNLCG